MPSIKLVKSANMTLGCIADFLYSALVNPTLINVDAAVAMLGLAGAGGTNVYVGAGRSIIFTCTVMPNSLKI